MREPTAEDVRQAQSAVDVLNGALRDDDEARRRSAWEAFRAELRSGTLSREQVPGLWYCVDHRAHPAAAGEIARLYDGAGRSSDAAKAAAQELLDDLAHYEAMSSDDLWPDGGDDEQRPSLSVVERR